MCIVHLPSIQVYATSKFKVDVVFKTQVLMDQLADRLTVLDVFGPKAIKSLYAHVKLYNFIATPIEQDAYFGDGSIPIKTGLNLLLDQNYQPLYKALLKKFPDIRDIPKNQTALLEQNQKQFVAGLSGIYSAMSIFLQYQNDVLEALKIADKLKSLSFDTSPDIVFMILNCIKSIVSGHHLINSLGDRRKLVVSVYAKAYFLENGINEPLFRILADLCINVDKIQHYIIEIFQPVSNIVGLALVACNDFPTQACLSAEILFKTKSLHCKMGMMYENLYEDKLHRMLYSIEPITNAIIATTLAHPVESASINYCCNLVDQFVIHGDFTVDLVSELELVGKSAPKSKIFKPLIELVQQSNRLVVHSDKLKVVSKLLQEALLVIKADSGFIAPKCCTIMSLLALGYNELDFYFRHNKNRINWTAVTLLHNMMDIKEILLKNIDSISTYYQQVMTSGALEIEDYLEIIQSSAESQSIKNLWQHMHKCLQENKLADLRATWLRLQVYYAYYTPSQQSTQSQMIKVMNELYFKSKFADTLVVELESVCPLHQLYYFRYSLMEHIQTFSTLNTFDDVYTTTSKSIQSCLSVVSLFPKAFTLQSERLIGFVKSFVEIGSNAILDSTCSVIHGINLEFARLFLLSHSFGHQSMLTEEEKQTMVMPGFESMLQQKNITLLKWASQQARIHYITSKLNTITVGNSKFNLHYQFIQKLNKVLVGVLRNSIIDNGQSPYSVFAKDSPIMQQTSYMIKRPTLFFTGLMGYFQCLKRLKNDYLFYQTTQLLRDQSHLSTCTTELNQAQQQQQLKKKKNVQVDVDKLLATQLINWLMEVIGNKGVAHNFGISPVRKSLESYGQDPFPLHHFICYKEFYAIAECIGPNARVLLREKIYSVAKQNFDDIFQFIKPIYDSDMDPTALIGKTRTAPEYNDWMLQLGTLGMLFELEDLTSEAFSDAMEINASYLKAVVEYGDVSLHVKMPELVEMLTSSGIKSKTAKNKFQLTSLDLKKFTNTLSIVLVSLALDETIMYYPFHGSNFIFM